MNKEDLISKLQVYANELNDANNDNASEAYDAVLLAKLRVNESEYRESYDVLYNNIDVKASYLKKLIYSHPSPQSQNQINKTIEELLLVSAALLAPTTSDLIKSVEKQVLDKANKLDEFYSLSKKNYESTENIYSKLLELKTNVETEVGKLTEMIKAGVYSVTAKNEFKKSRAMRLWAIVSFVLAALIAFLFIYFSITKNITIIGTSIEISLNNVSLLSVLSKILGSAIISLPGFYLARESSKHYKEAVRSQRMAHELGSLDGYFADLDDKELRSKIKAVLALQHFGNADNIYSVNEEKMPTVDITKVFTNIFPKMVEKNP